MLRNLVLVCSLLLFFVGCSDSDEPTAPKAAIQMQEGETITLKDINNGAKHVIKRVKDGFVLEGDEDRIIIFDFYATYCPPCRKEAPALMDLQVKYKKDVLLVGLNTFEEVTNEYVYNEFRSQFNAFYFISNAKQNEKIISTVLKDINYTKTMQIPFKVVLKNGKYQTITDIYNSKPDNKFYIGQIDTAIIEKDLEKILSK